jgi:uncharacterized protein
MKPWREIAVPHQDVLKGTFQQSEFAADLAKVHDGSAPEGYLDPVAFFDRTFITEGMRLLLDSVIRRLSGQGGDPVVQLQTAFGGGKTHTMLAVYHLANSKVPASNLSGVSSILDAAGLTELPKAKTVVLDGTRFSPSQPKKYGEQSVRTLWGEMAWQLGGADAFAKVAESDINGTAPDSSLIENLLTPYQPVVVLVDELVAYLRQFEDGRSYPGGTFDSNLTFIQNLTQAFKAVPKAMLLISLPASKLSEAGSARGRRAMESIEGTLSLASLEKTVGRVHALWKPVGTEEAFEIVRRRLFTTITDTAQASEVCRSFADSYSENRQDLPKETLESRYYDRMVRAYPIHPEVFDRLYEDWSSLDNFQRTRGVLSLMASVIHRLWNDDNKDPFIMPGNLPLSDAQTRNKMIYYLPQGWDPVVEGDIDGDRSEAVEIESHDARFGSLQACRRLARTIFLGSAPTTASQSVRGIDAQRVLLGVLQPGQQISIYKDALRRLSDRLHYLNTGDSRFWFDVRPNLRREMEDRKRRFTAKEHLHPEVQNRLRGLIHGTTFAGIHIFTPSADVPDDWKMHLVILPPTAPYSRGAGLLATKAALEILNSRGDQPRMKRNRLLFLAADAESTARLDDLVCSFKAWESIVKDIDLGDLNLDQLQSRQANKNRDSAAEAVNRTIREAYRWLLAPTEEAEGKGISAMRWESFPLNTGSDSFTKEIERVLREHELVIETWAPIHLDMLLRTWFWKDGVKDIEAKEIWQKTCHYLYMPRLKDSNVFQATLAEGSETRDYFGLALGKRDGKYLSFNFGKRPPIHLEETWIIEPGAAAEYETALRAAEEAAQPKPRPVESTATNGTPTAPTQTPIHAGQPTKTANRRFYGTVTLDPLLAKKQFADIVDEIVQQFTTRVGDQVHISVELHAQTAKGFDAGLERTVRENCRTLKFKSFDFETED